MPVRRELDAAYAALGAEARRLFLAGAIGRIVRALERESRVPAPLRTELLGPVLALLGAASPPDAPRVRALVRIGERHATALDAEGDAALESLTLACIIALEIAGGLGQDPARAVLAALDTVIEQHDPDAEEGVDEELAVRRAMITLLGEAPTLAALPPLVDRVLPWEQRWAEDLRRAYDLAD